MTAAASANGGGTARAFSHEALLYAGASDFVDRVAGFIREGTSGSEPVMVAVSPAKIEVLRDALGSDADGVHFADMTQVGGNPGRIISAWREFLDEHAGDAPAIRGVGEPIWAGRSAQELAECERHEALLNLAFVNTPFRLLCPYDTGTLTRSVIDEALRNHPVVANGHGNRGSDTYRVISAPELFEQPLPDPPVETTDLEFDATGLGEIRTVVSRLAAEHGCTRDTVEGFVLAVNEVATNSVRHGGGRGLLRVWADGAELVCEVRDHGRIDEPLIGRIRPEPTANGGFGLWLANQLCDLVQIRWSPDGSVVRLHLRTPA